MADCPICVTKVELDADTIIGELIDCSSCGSQLEVISLDPEALDVAPELEEDWGQ